VLRPFADLAPVERESISDEFNDSAGYDVSRSWQAGDTVDEVYKLGDLTNDLGAEKLSLRQIGDITGLNLDNVAISDFP